MARLLEIDESRVRGRSVPTDIEITWKRIAYFITCREFTRRILATNMVKAQ